MDCHCNDQGSRCDASSNRRTNSCRQNNSSSRQRMMGNYHNPRYSSGMNRMERGCSRQTMNSSAERCLGCGCLKSECQCNMRRDSRNTGCEYSSRNCDCEYKESKCMVNAMRATEYMPIGMTYTPYQEFSSLYEWDIAFCQGTLFADLDKPFLVTDCVQGGGRR